MEWINRIKNSKSKNGSQDIEKENDSKIILTKNEGVLKMSVFGHPTLDMFFEKVHKLPEEDQKVILKLPLSILVDSDQEVNSGNYIWTIIDNKRYIIMSNRESININQTKELSDHIEERSIAINMMINGISVYSAIHDNNFSTQENKHFNIDNYSSTPSVFELSSEEAKEEYELLFNDLIHDEKILTELNGVIEIEDIKSMIDNRFSYVVTNSQHKR